MSYDNAFEAEITKIAKRHEDHFVEKITNPIAITDHSVYMYNAGNLNVLRAILPEILEEARDNLAKR